MRILFLGSPPFATAVLRHLLASEHQVVGVVTPRSKARRRGQQETIGPVAALAEEHGVTLLQPKGLRDPETLQALRTLNPEVLAVASYGEILNEEALRLAPNGALNVHGSCLPRWRGAAPVQAAIQAGDLETGVSIQRMVLGLDEGDVLLEKRTPIQTTETAGELMLRLAELGGSALVEALDQLVAKTAKFTPQDPAAVTMTRKIKKADGRLDWSLGPINLERFVRAMSPWPGATTRLPDGRTLTVLELEPTTGSGLAGTFLGGADLRIACGNGGQAVTLLQVKPEGKSAMAGDAFLRGSKLTAGDLLGKEPTP